MHDMKVRLSLFGKDLHSTSFSCEGERKIRLKAQNMLLLITDTNYNTRDFLTVT